jgi:hypothetical protein
LRRSLRVTKRSPLYNRELWNQFEHFDEKLEGWYKDPANRNGYVGRNIGPEGMIGVSAKRRFAHFDPSTGKVTFLGHSMLLDRVVAEAARIRPLAEAESQKNL